MVEPLSVAIHASRRANLEPGSTVLVFGAGTVGLLVAAVAKISGSGTIVIADIDSSRVDFAVNNKFAHKGFTVSMKRGSSVGEDLRTAKDTASKIGETIKDNGERVGEVDAVFECTGVPSCVQAGIYVRLPLCNTSLRLTYLHRHLDLVGSYYSLGWEPQFRLYRFPPPLFEKSTLSEFSDMPIHILQV